MWPQEGCTWITSRPEVRLYKRKQESKKKERKHALDQESMIQEKNDNDQERRKEMENVN